MPEPEPGSDDTLRRLMNVGRQLVTELDPETVLERLVEEARAATGARYAALGILNDERTELDRLVHVGIDAATERAISELPRGRGVLGVLIEHPSPLRLDDVGSHDESFGFPVGHPKMRSFLGVPVMMRGLAWGNLYLAEKENGEQFTKADEDAVIILSEWAATAIENARLYKASEERRIELERAVRGLDAARNIADAIGVESELDRILELIVKRGRALVDARAILIFLVDGDDLLLAATAGQAEDKRGIRIPLDTSLSGEALRRRRPIRIADANANVRTSPADVGVGNAQTAMIVPMMHRHIGLGVLVAFDRGSEQAAFTAADEALLRTFAASASNAVAISRSVEADRLRSTIAAAEAERRRWARELHDETLQALGGLRVLLSGALRRNDPEDTRETVGHAIADIESEIENLRAIITELRPMLLDDLGLGPAIDALVERRGRDGLDISTDLVLSDERDEAVLSPELETTVYRLIQETLTNIVKHARATHVAISVQVADREVVVAVSDDGVGFDVDASASGFGLDGIRERVYLAGGALLITSTPGEGTRVRARFPLSGGELLRDEAVPDRGVAHGLG